VTLTSSVANAIADEGGEMVQSRLTVWVAVLATVGIAAVAGGEARSSGVVLPPGNAAEQWNKIAEDTVVGSGAFQNEGLVYMGYATAAMYDATAPLAEKYTPLEPSFRVYKKAAADAAVVEAGYRTLVHFFPNAGPKLDAYRAESLAAIPDGKEKLAGIRIGWVAANQIITLRSGDGLATPIASTSTFPTLPEGPGVWRLTPPAYAAPQTPWVANVKPFILANVESVLPPPPPALSSSTWVDAFNEIKLMGESTSTARSPEQTAVAKFWTANVIAQYNGTARGIATSQSLGVADAARLFAMVDVVAADAQISVMRAKYKYLFWRPVSAIDPTSVKPTGDGFGSTPGVSDGNPLTIEKGGWRPLVTTPNHPEYPAAHGSMTSAMAEVLSTYLGTQAINVQIHGFDAAGAPGNFDAVRTYATADDLRKQIVEARLWAGLHYRFSSEAGVALGKTVAQYDLTHAFGPLSKKKK
jgi:hypothetical protein